MAHLDGLPDDAPDHTCRILHDKVAHVSALMREPPRKPSNWWAFEREPWKRVNEGRGRQGEGGPCAPERVCLRRRRAGAGAPGGWE